MDLSTELYDNLVLYGLLAFVAISIIAGLIRWVRNFIADLKTNEKISGWKKVIRRIISFVADRIKPVKIKISGTPVLTLKIEPKVKRQFNSPTVQRWLNESKYPRKGRYREALARDLDRLSGSSIKDIMSSDELKESLSRVRESAQPVLTKDKKGKGKSI